MKAFQAPSGAPKLVGMIGNLPLRDIGQCAADITALSVMEGL